KSLFLCEADGGFGAFLGTTRLATELMEHSRTTQGKTQAEGVCTLLRQRHRLLAPRQPLRRTPQRPQCPSATAVAHHTHILPMQERRGTVLLGIVECHPLCPVRERQGCLSQVEQRCPQGTVHRHEHGSILDLLRQRQELLAQGVCRL